MGLVVVGVFCVGGLLSCILAGVACWKQRQLRRQGLGYDWIKFTAITVLMATIAGGVLSYAFNLESAKFSGAPTSEEYGMWIAYGFWAGTIPGIAAMVVYLLSRRANRSISDGNGLTKT